MARTVRVFKRDGIWVVKRDGNSKSSGNFDTQKEAYIKAREIALNNGLTITVYYPTGGIQKVITPKESGRSSDEEGCFITTACTKYFGLDDNCQELTILRAFRDNYMLSSLPGKLRVKKYYRIAPVLVKKLENHAQQEKIYKTLYKQILKACDLIKQGRLVEAENLYTQTVVALIGRLKISQWL